MTRVSGKALVGAMFIFGVGAAAVAPRIAPAQGGENVLEAPQVRDMIKAMGYETRELNTEAGKEKYEFKVSKDDLDIPIAAEVSASKRYIWMTVFLGETKSIKEFGGRTEKLLKKNGEIQPCQFYVTKSDRLMLGLALENRAIDPVILKRAIVKVSDDVAESKDLWTAD